jgi:hypothetical protein
VQHSEETTEQIPLRDRITWPPSPTEEKYPYDEWFDGSIWKLHMYQDFFIHPNSMRSALYMAARRKGKKIKTHCPTTQNCIYVQAVKK